MIEVGGRYRVHGTAEDWNLCYLFESGPDVLEGQIVRADGVFNGEEGKWECTVLSGEWSGDYFWFLEHMLTRECIFNDPAL